VSLSLVDPDNRRPVDWERRRVLLANPDEDSPDGRKLRLITRALRMRAEHPEAFAGSYEPIEAGDRTVAFTRGGIVRVEVGLDPGGTLSLETLE
jgi:(1->4)-alpha-D-glucan 1-alpha-D-glucosylmutase